MTTFGDQVYQYGGAPVNGLFTTGKVWFVRPSTGSDGNSGKRPDQALKTMSKAHSLMTADKNEVVYLLSESNTAASTTDYQSATLTWSKDLTHVVGVCAPCKVSQRSRIAQLSTATGIDPLMTVSADGASFRNFQLFHGVADATSLVAMNVTGTRNYFENVHIAGMGDATTVTTNAASLKITGGAENVWKECVIGLDTISRDNTSKGEIWCDTAATRNMFDDCLIQAYVSHASYVFVTIEDATAIDRWLWFRNCLFMSKSTNKTIDVAEVFGIPGSISQGAIVLQDCAVMNDGGAPVWTAGTEGIIWANMGAPTASAAGGLMTNL